MPTESSHVSHPKVMLLVTILGLYCAPGAAAAAAAMSLS